MRPLLLAGLLLASTLTSAALAGGGNAPARPNPNLPVQPGQAWVIAGTTAQGEQFTTTLRLNADVPTGTPLTFRADRGAMLLDVSRSALVALDLADARGGGIGLACVVVGNLHAASLPGVLGSGTLEQLSPQLEAALAVANATHTPADRAAAAKELGLGTCTLRRQ